MFDEISRAFRSPDSVYVDKSVCISQDTVRILDIRFFLRDQLENLDRFVVSGGIVRFVEELQSILLQFESLMSKQRMKLYVSATDAQAQAPSESSRNQVETHRMFHSALSSQH